MEQVTNLLPLVRSHIGTERGDMSAFARNHGVSLSYVSLIMSGKRMPPMWLINEMGVLIKARKSPSGAAITEYYIDK